MLNTAAGRAALESNYTVTGAIQTGSANQPALQPFTQEQGQALKDAAITSGNAFQLADGLGTTLAGAYHTLVTFTSNDDGNTSTFTSVSPDVATLIGYTSGLTGADSAFAKLFFANETSATAGGVVPVTDEAAAMLTAAGGTTDVLGKAYHHPAGSPGADPYGDSRPFQTETHVLTYAGLDYFGVAASNSVYLHGPTQDLEESPSFPSGHTTYGYTESLLLAMFVPERFPQMVARGAEYGNHRIVLGAHYAMDVLGGRTLAYYDVAHLLAEDPTYVGQRDRRFTITSFQAAFTAGRAEVRKALALACGKAIAACAKDDSSRFRDAAADEAFYESTQTYGLPVVYEATAQKVEDVGSVAPEAGYLLTAAFPHLTLAQADAILTSTEGPGGGYLDDGSAFGLYSRLDLYRAAMKAALIPGALPD